MHGRRSVILNGSAVVAAALFGGCRGRTSRPNVDGALEAARRLTDLEQSAGGTLGVFMVDLSSGRHVGLNEDRRFGMCSTFKVLLAAAVLREADRGWLGLEERIPFSEADIVRHAPATSRLLKQGWMTIGELARAIQGSSDNTAANLLIRRLGGPAAVTALIRAMGDRVTRLDRYETELNVVPPGEIRDTTSPRAMGETLGRIIVGDVLSDASRAHLIRWMRDTGTGLQRLRASFPEGWRAGDKTGTGIHPNMPNRHNDVAVAWPPGGGPLVVSAYYEAPGHFTQMRPQDDAVLAETGRIAAAWSAAAPHP